MSPPIEHLSVEIARHITLHLHPAHLSNLLTASRGLRRLFSPDESEFKFVRKHLRHQFGEVLVTPACDDAEWTTRLEMAADVPFRKLPDVYAIAWLARSWDCLADREALDMDGPERAASCVVVVFPDLEVKPQSIRLEFRAGPHRPIAWMESILLKALSSQCVQVKYRQEWTLVIRLASLLDSVAIVEAVLGRLFPQLMKSAVSSTGAGKVVMAADMFFGWFLLRNCPLDAGAEAELKDNFAWCMATVAEEATERGAIHLLDYALQHPLVPVAFGYLKGRSDALINCASRRAHIHAVHYLLANPLPLAPPPASRPIRPTYPRGLSLEDLQLMGLPAMIVEYLPANPVARLTHLGEDNEPPLQNLFTFLDHDPLCAATYFLDYGAPVNRDGVEGLGPLHRAAQHASSGIVRLLIERGANIDERAKGGLTPLHVAARENNPDRAMELLECGANRDAVVECLLGDVEEEDEDVDEEEEEDAEEEREITPKFRADVGWTPLKVAVEKKSFDVVRVLLRACAKLLVRKLGEDDELMDNKLRFQLLD
ncbi:hypothetical protein HDU96_007293 [Phlyctochytrium bullatum]|nr:hypothetical protein HDU96_007293 [Phlyctochytrium bullatum]